MFASKFVAFRWLGWKEICRKNDIQISKAWLSDVSNTFSLNRTALRVNQLAWTNPNQALPSPWNAFGCSILWDSIKIMSSKLLWLGCASSSQQEYVYCNYMYNIYIRHFIKMYSSVLVDKSQFDARRFLLSVFETMKHLNNLKPYIFSFMFDTESKICKMLAHVYLEWVPLLAVASEELSTICSCFCLFFYCFVFSSSFYFLLCLPVFSSLFFVVLFFLFCRACPCLLLSFVAQKDITI